MTEPLDLDAIRRRLAAWDADQPGQPDIWTFVEDVRALLAAVERLTAERDRFREHSVTLNTVGFRMADALGQVPEGDDAVMGNPVAQASELIEQRNELHERLCVIEGERDGVREELARTVGELDDARADRDRYRTAAVQIREARRRLSSRLIASAYLLDVPFTNAPDHSPWTGIKAALYALDVAVDACATQTPGVDSGTSEARTAGSGDTAAESEPIPAELSTHYGPTATDPEPGKEWHDDCGGEVYSFKEGRICSKCEMAEDAPAAHGDAGPADLGTREDT